MSMESESRPLKNVYKRPLMNYVYEKLFRRTAVFGLMCVLGGIAFEICIHKGPDTIIDRLNAGHDFLAMKKIYPDEED